MPRALSAAGARALAVTAALFASACNGVFYYPMVGTLTTPRALGLDYEDFFVQSEPGVPLHFWRIAARGARRGTVLQFHGNGENMSSHFLFAAWLAEAGFDVVAFDYRGYGASGGEVDRAGMVVDGRTALRVAAERGGDVFVLAQSLGGAIAVPALVEERPPTLAAVALDSTFAHYRSVVRRVVGGRWYGWPFQVPLSFLVTNELSPGDYAADFRWPVVVLHAPGDPVVPYAEGRELYESLGAKDKQFWEVPSNRHTFAFSAAPAALGFRRRLVAFFDSRSSRAKPALKR